MDLEEFLKEAIPLMAEDLGTARAELGITSARAAKRARLSTTRYRALEKGSIRRTAHNAGELVSVAKRMGLKDIRASYLHEIGQYMRIDLSKDGPLTIFIDALDSDTSKLREQGYFVTPHGVLVLFNRIGFYSTFESRKLVDKQLAELWIAAVFTLCLDQGRDYYVSLVRDDPPDVEVLQVDQENSAVTMIKLEITRHGRYSKNVLDVIDKKLLKRYEDGTVLVVLVEESANLDVAELHEYIRKNNPHNQRIFIIGGGPKAGKLKIIPWDKVTSPALHEMAWMEMNVDMNNASRGYRGYGGVVYKHRSMSRFPQVFPVFVKKIQLER